MALDLWLMEAVVHRLMMGGGEPVPTTSGLLGVTDTGGWGGVTLAYNVRSPEEVDEDGRTTLDRRAAHDGSSGAGWPAVRASEAPSSNDGGRAAE